MAWRKVGNISGITFAGRVTTGSDGTFTLAFPTGMFSAAPIVSVDAISATPAIVSITAVSNLMIQGKVGLINSAIATLGVGAGIEVNVIARAPT